MNNSIETRPAMETSFNLRLPHRTEAETVAECLLISLVDILAFGGNLLVVLAVWRNLHLRTSTNLFITSLAITDFLTACVAAPLTLTTLVTGEWAMGSIACNIQGFFIYILSYSTIVIMTLTALNRYCRVVNVRLYRRFFIKKRALVMLSSAWVFVIVIILVFPLSGSASFEFSPLHAGCLMSFTSKKAIVVYYCLKFPVFLVVPMVVITFCYVKVSAAIRESSLRMASFGRNQRIKRGIAVNGTRLSKEEIQITRSIFFLIIGFAACWIPEFIISTLVRFRPKGLPHIITSSVLFFEFLSSATNPFIYATSSKAFRTEFRLIFQDAFQKVMSILPVAKYPLSVPVTPVVIAMADLKEDQHSCHGNDGFRKGS